MSEQMWIVFICGIVFGFVPPLVLLKVVTSRFWRDGYEQGCDDEEASHASCERDHYPPGGQPWPEADEPDDLADTIVPWTDTQQHLADLAAAYYEPLVRGAGENPPVTTASCLADDMTVKGDSPGPGLPPDECPACGSWYADMHPVVDGERIELCRDPWHRLASAPRSNATPSDLPTTPTFDQLAAELALASAPPLVPGPPPGDSAAGAEPELAGTVVRTDEDGDAYCVTCGHYPAYNKCGHRCCTPEPPAPEVPRHLSAATSGQRSTDPSPGVDSSDNSGAGADPWDLIAAGLAEDPELNESIKAEAARCSDIRRELAELGKATAAWRPALTEWRT